MRGQLESFTAKGMDSDPCRQKRNLPQATQSLQNGKSSETGLPGPVPPQCGPGQMGKLPAPGAWPPAAAASLVLSSGRQAAVLWELASWDGHVHREAQLPPGRCAGSQSPTGNGTLLKTQEDTLLTRSSLL